MSDKEFDQKEFNTRYENNKIACKTFVNALIPAVEDGRVIIDSADHFDANEIKEYFLETLKNFSIAPWPFDYEKYQKAIGQENLHEPLRIRETRDECYKCGQSLSWNFYGKSIKVVSWEDTFEKGFVENSAPCKFANILAPITARINVPSGKLVISNDLRHIFTEEMVWDGEKSWSREFSINHFAGKVNYIQHYAKHQMLTGYLGDGGVSIYHSPTGILITQCQENPQKTLKTDEDIFHFVGEISLELWWYGAADLNVCNSLNAAQLQKTLNKEKRFSLIGHEVAILDVEPGQYELQHMYQDVMPRIDQDRKKLQIISKIVKVGNLDG